MNPAILAILVIGFGGGLSLLCNLSKVERVRAGGAVLTGLGSCLLGSVIALLWVIVRIFRAGFGDYSEFLPLLFLLPVLVVGSLAGIHAVGYLSGKHGSGRLGLFWFLFNLTLAMMIGVTQADQPVTFLLAWEGMGLFSFALVAFEHQSRESMRAAWIYFLACHAGGALLLMMFFFRNNGDVASPLAFFSCGMLGFGLKAGFPLLHIWLPEAHPAAPAPVSAVLSAGMINLGFYGILRWVALPGMVSAQQLGMTLLLVGMAGALLGVLFALPQKNLKRLLAYSSIENMGIIALGLGLGFLGSAWQNVEISVLGFCGAFLHLLNHAALKGGLFLAAGNVFKATGQLNIDLLGGLQKRLPRTGTSFTMSAIALSGLPPGNAFFGELLLYVAAGKGIALGTGASVACSLVAMLTLALSGGLAATVFSKAAGAIFLGEPRSKAAAEAERLPRSMTTALLLFAVLSGLLLVFSPLLALKFATVISGEAFLFQPNVQGVDPILLEQGFRILLLVLGSFILLLWLVAVLYWFRVKALPRGKRNVRRGTWDCGYARPDARMEYTGTAFVQPLVDLFAGILRPIKRLHPPKGFFPVDGEVRVSCKDGGEQLFWRPLVDWTVRIAIFTHRLQSGHLHLYILFMLLALLAMLIWGFAGGM